MVVLVEIQMQFPSPIDKDADLKSLLVIAYQHGRKISRRHMTLSWVVCMEFVEGTSNVHCSIRIKQIGQSRMSEKLGKCLAGVKIIWIGSLTCHSCLERLPCMSCQSHSLQLESTNQTCT